VTQYVNFKPGDRTRLKGKHWFRDGPERDRPILNGVPDRAEVIICDPSDGYHMDYPAPHVIVTTDLDDNVWRSGNGHWIREDALEPMGPTDQEVEEALRSIRGE
jgi:hypothetical protein